MRNNWTKFGVMVALGWSQHCSAAQSQRAVMDHTVISRRNPPIEITLPRSAHYIGADHFVLTEPNLGSFDKCEVFGFVDSPDGSNIRKFFRIQFEGFLPNHPDLRYHYSSQRQVIIGGLQFYAYTGIWPRGSLPKPGSDDAHYYALIAGHGYRPGDMMFVRLVHVDATKRKELMIIYAESLAPTGYTALQLEKGSTAHAEWTTLADGLVRKASRSVIIEPIANYLKNRVQTE